MTDHPGNLGLGADDLLTSTRAVRKRIDFDRPVERAVIEECVEIAQQAPTGSNTQGWRWVFVEDPDTKAALAELYRASFYPYVGEEPPSPDEALAATSSDQSERIRSSAMYMAARLHEVPLMAVPCIEGRVGPGMETFDQASVWGSILPAVWSFCLALRERGLGSSWTTLHLPYEREAAEILGIPYDEVTQAGLFPIGYTLGTEFKPARREPAARWIHWDRW
ncbi:MAG: nitroreductase family protein [Acidimicrobiales bacterium]